MNLLELLTGQALLEIVDEEVKRLQRKQNVGELTGGDVAALEKLAKTYHVLRAESRDAEKNIGKLSDTELASLADESDT